VIPDGVAAATAWALDQLVGEPPLRWHPVARFGTAMSRLEQATHRDTRTAGVIHLAIGGGSALAAGVLLRRLIGRPAATLAATTVAVAGRMLTDEARAVLDHTRIGDLPAARIRVAGLVGRDTEHLDTTEIVRAVIESVAENTVDAVAAPILWATIGGAPAVLAHRAINTLDAMVGHHTPRYNRFGWAAARSDDIANWLPARLSALAVAAIRPRCALAIARTIRRDARRHPSPNGGVVEAAFAAALGVRLGGSNTYAGHTEDRGQLGDGPPPAVTDGDAAVRLARRAGGAFALGFALLPVAKRTIAGRLRRRPSNTSAA
jgi:adenosylcobinamide-phosphate synthase